MNVEHLHECPSEIQTYEPLSDPAPRVLQLLLLLSLFSGLSLTSPVPMFFVFTTLGALFLLPRTSQFPFYADNSFLSFRSGLSCPLLPKDFTDHPVSLSLPIGKNHGHLFIYSHCPGQCLSPGRLSTYVLE